MTMLPTYFPSPPQGVWHLGPLPIRAYALFIITGIVVALMIGDRRWVARGGQRGVIYDIALWVVPFGLIGGRLYHLATDWRTYWGPSGAGLGAALRIWDGGLGIWGAVALGLLGAWIGCRRHGIPLPAFTDAVAPGIILAQAIGRLGNYFNQELYGRETTVPWGLEIFYRRDPTGYIDPHSLDGISTGQLAVVVQPTFLYELIWNVLVFVILIYIDRRFAIGHGRLFASYVALYCVGRFWVELLRDDSATHIAGVRINSFTSTFVFIGAVVYIVLAPKGREDPESLRGNTDVGDESAESEPEVEPADELASVAAASAATAATAASAGDDGEQPEAEAVEASAEEPEAEDAKAEEPEAAEPEAEEAKAEEPVVEEPEAVEPEVEQPGAEEPKAEEPEVEEPEEPAAEEAAAEPEEPAAEEPKAEESEVEEPEPEEPAAEEAKAEEPEVEEPEPEAEEPAAEEAAAEPEEPEAEEPQPEAVEAAAEEPEPEEPEATKPEPEEPVADEPEAEEPEAEPETAEPGTEVSEAEETADVAEENEPESAAAVETKSDEPAADKAADESLAGGDEKETRRRWPLRLRSRRSGR